MATISTNTYYDTNSNILGNSQNQLAGLLNSIGSSYKFLYFKPDSNGYPTGYGACYASREYSTGASVPMVPINTLTGTNKMLHTDESCRLNAALLQTNNKWKEQETLNKWPSSQIKPGLNFKSVTGYMGQNAKYFIGQTGTKTGLATDFSAAANTNGSTGAYSVEWYGFFKPLTTGNWTFTINSTKNNFLWVGDVAVNDYTYTTAQLTSGKSQTFTFNCNKGRLYPIRIQCGFVNQGDTFNLKVFDPMSADMVLSDLFLTYYNADGSVFDKQMMYYALTDSGTPGLYNCLVSSQAAGDLPKFKTQPGSYSLKTIWQLLNDGDPGLSQYNKFQFVPSIIGSTSGTLSITTNSDSIISSITDAATKTSITFTAPVPLTLSDSGQLSSGSTNINTVPSSNSQVVVANADWLAYASENKTPSSITDISTITGGIAAGQVILISQGGMYKLEMSVDGNLVLKTSSSACSTSSSDSVNYTSASDNSYYLYRVDADEKMDKMFMTSNGSQTLAPISYDNAGFKLSTLTADDYNKYDNYYPEDTTGAVAKGVTECKAACKDDPTCKYIYSYKSAGTDYCLKKSDGHLPNQFIPQQPTTNIQSSALYIRSYQTNLPASDPRNNIKQTNTNNYSSYSDYELLIDKPFIMSDPHNIGYNGLDKDLRNRLIINYNFVKGHGQPVGQNPIVETFNNHGYVDGNKVRETSGNPGDTDNLPNRIQQQQITPLNNIAADYSNLLGKIDGKYREIKTDLAGYNASRNLVASDSTVQGDAGNDSRKKYDFETKGRTLLFNERKPSMQDAINEDLNMLILQENQMYMLGAITIATLLVGAVYFGKE